MHATDSTTFGSGMSEGSGQATDNELYDPWMIMTCRKIGERVSKNAMVMEGPTGSVKKMMSHEVGQGNNNKSSKLG